MSLRMEVKVKGRTFVVEVWDNGSFNANVDGEAIARETLNKLKDAIGERLKKKPLNIPFIEWNEPGTSWRHRGGEAIRRGKVVSIHSGNGNWIVEYDNRKGVKEQIHSHDKSDLLKHTVNLAKLKALFQAKERAEETYRKYRNSFQLEVNIEGSDE